MPKLDKRKSNDKKYLFVVFYGVLSGRKITNKLRQRRKIETRILFIKVKLSVCLHNHGSSLSERRQIKAGEIKGVRLKNRGREKYKPLKTLTN